MSPGPAARLLLEDARHAVITAVGTELTRGPPRLFRHQLDVLRQWPPLRTRPSMIASYDDGDRVRTSREGASPTSCSRWANRSP